ncbi:hypothetical protein [Caldicellulosiruptor hydrothermalis]|nr:hypothetical protein [Caldicellulosiruptor hydrothermalis]
MRSFLIYLKIRIALGFREFRKSIFFKLGKDEKRIEEMRGDEL